MGNSHLVIDFSFIMSPFLLVFGGRPVICIVWGVAFLAGVRIMKKSTLDHHFKKQLVNNQQGLLINTIRALF